MLLAPGTVVDQRYEVHAAVGTGGQAIVYRVRHCQLGTWHAMKVITQAHGAARKRILREGQLQASLRHPHVVRVTDVVMCNEAPALIMDFIDGPDLGRVIDGRRLDVEQADQIGQAIISAVAAAHAQGLVHRDLKPENILLARSDDGHVIPMVTDFGIATQLTVDRRTRTGTVMGTPYYMSPEQVRDLKSVDARSDIWALGAVLYEMLSGDVAFRGDSVFEIWNAVQRVEFVPLRELAPDIPERLIAAVEGALKHDPADRHQTCEEMLEMWTGAPSRSSNLRLTLDLDVQPWHLADENTHERLVTPTVVPPEPIRPTTLTGRSGLGIAAMLGGGLLSLGVGLGALALAGIGTLSGLGTEGRSARAQPADEVVPPTPAMAAPNPEPAVVEDPVPAVTPETADPVAVEPSAPLSDGPEAPATPPEAEGGSAPQASFGQVSAEGARVRLVANGTAYTLPGEVPTGEYEVWVNFGDAEFRYPRSLRVGQAGSVQVICNPGTQLCLYRGEGESP